MNQEDEHSYAVIGAAMAVHRELGAGFLENVYHRALERELPVYYRGSQIASDKVDFLCFGWLLVEIKALGRLTSIETAQVLNYLKASGLQKGLILNFGTPSLQQKRIVLTSETK